ncbi:MAG: hypothetical protein J3Q66DRAFT_333349 [Benniella sp.]|nr:MAG: hypothetical protein J3Q66DRAFT_333349 [Benniella sp.]
MYILGGMEAIGGASPSRQTFMIDLSVSWNTNAPIYTRLPDGPSAYAAPSAISVDEENWVTVVKSSCYAYNFQAASWGLILTDNAIDQNTGFAAVTDPTTSYIQIPAMIKGYGGVTSELVLDVRAKTVSSRPMLSTLHGGRDFAVVWSVEYKSMFYFGGTVDGLFVYSKDAIGFDRAWSNPATNGTAPSPRMHPCLVSIDGGKRLIVAGGLSKASNSSLNDLYIFDIATRTWTSGPSIPQEQIADGSACGISNNQLIIWGGAYNSPQSSRMAGIAPLIFDVKTKKWTSSYNAPPKPSVSSTTSILPQTSSGPSSGTPSSNPSTTLTGGGNNRSLIVAILATVVGVLIVTLIAGVLFYRSRSKRTYHASGESGSSLNHLDSAHKNTYSGVGYPEGQGYTPPPGNVPYPLPPAPIQASSWTTHHPQSGTDRNPEANIQAQRRDVRSPLNRMERDLNTMGRPHKGVYGAQQYSQHPHTIQGHSEEQGYTSGEVYEMDNNSQQAFINRRGPERFDDSVKVSYNSRPVNFP